MIHVYYVRDGEHTMIPHVQLQIWDTAGMEKFRNAPALVPQYYHNTDGIVLVFDITEPGSFDGLDNWISEMKQYCTHGSRTERVNMILVGNKLDLSDERKVYV
jgi:small GTP-binding protein